MCTRRNVFLQSIVLLFHNQVLNLKLKMSCFRFMVTVRSHLDMSCLTLYCPSLSVLSAFFLTLRRFVLRFLNPSFCFHPSHFLDSPPCLCLCCILDLGSRTCCFHFLTCLQIVSAFVNHNATLLLSYRQIWR